MVQGPLGEPLALEHWEIVHWGVASARVIPLLGSRCFSLHFLAFFPSHFVQMNDRRVYCGAGHFAAEVDGSGGLCLGIRRMRRSDGYIGGIQFDPHIHSTSDAE